MGADWDGTDEHLARHGVTPEQAIEAENDPERVLFRPDYKSITGDSIRIIGFSPSYGDILVVITFTKNAHHFGATAYRAQGKDRRYYNQEG